MRELMIDVLLNIQERTKTNNRIWRWHEYRFMYDDNLKETLEKMNDKELLETYNKFMERFVYQ